ncbi:hypothetical protein DEA8626_03254 [Defluviimonas aquaemixtae]|uniref:Uncharacterized protein n=1 Tax=Albidovulum aquaemixtae TaxID=1542388 RepID=A0A2R8BLI4_9RHOB|nr:hypothetical protein [Defluviimonas aquaemixtae]SPH24204.1 hypothetical protein DEA8626_03254 [Defluviimonas aquaemixtae]
MSDRAFRALFGVAGLLLLAMVLAGPRDCAAWVFCSFDAPGFPYSAREARAYLASLTDGALWRYLWIVQPLDLVFPALLCLIFREAFERHAPEKLAARLGRIAVIEAGVDYFENAVIRAMLKRPEGDFPDMVPLAATGLSTLKWLLIAFLSVALARLVLTQRPPA